MSAALLRSLAYLFWCEARHHQSAPNSWTYHEEHHVVRRDPREGKRLFRLARQADNEATRLDAEGL
jgi:hypothetical protein